MRRAGRRLLGLLAALTLPGALLYSFTSPIRMVDPPPERLVQVANGFDMQHLFFVVGDHPDEMSWPWVDPDGVIVLRSPAGVPWGGERAWLQRFAGHRFYPQVVEAVDAGRLRIDHAPARSYRETRALSVRVGEVAHTVCPRCGAGPSQFGPRIRVIGQTRTPGLATELARHFDPNEVELLQPFPPV